MNNKNLISIGKILNFHGIKGEAKIGYTLGNESKLKKLKEVIVFLNNEEIILDINSIKFHKKNAIIKFKNIDSINDLLKYKGLNLYVNKELFNKMLDDDEFLFNDLKGLKVYDEDGEYLGVIEELSENLASSLLSVRSKKSDKLYFVPFVKDLVLKINLNDGFIIVKNIEGLID